MARSKTFDHLFLGIGAMKAGTTWIYDALQRHPDIHFSREKEIHYLYAQHVNPRFLSDAARMRRARGYLAFDPEVSNRAVLQKRVAWTANWLQGPIDDAWFQSLFLHQGSARWVADFSNMSALVPAEGWAALHARTEKLRVLYTLRHPMERLWSHLKFHLKMQNALEKLNEWTIDDMEHHLRKNGDFLQHSDYVAAITRLRSALPTSCIHVDVFDRIPEEPRAFIADIEQFLGVPAHALPDDIVHRVINSTPTTPMPKGLADRFSDDVAQQIEGLKALGIALPARWG